MIIRQELLSVVSTITWLKKKRINTIRKAKKIVLIGKKITDKSTVEIHVDLDYLNSLRYPELYDGFIKSWKEIKLLDVIEYVRVNTYDISCENGIYPLISNIRDDNGILGYIDQFSYGDISITISNKNPVICYYHNYPVAIDQSVRLFKIKDNLIDPHLLTILINYYLINKDYQIISVKEILGIVIYVPIFYDSWWFLFNFKVK